MPPSAPLVINPGLSGEDFSVAALIATLRARAVAANLWREQVVAPQSVLFDQGEDCDMLFVLLSGLVKLSYRTLDGDEWIKSFIGDEGLFGADPADVAAGPIRYTARCIEASRIVRLPLTWVSAELAAQPELLRGVAGFAAWVLRRKQAREEMLLCLSPEERYRHILGEEPALVARLMQGDIARYIGVTPIAFSRIKRRIGAATVAGIQK
jgi:CRP-like cAMP-binding protein